MSAVEPSLLELDIQELGRRFRSGDASPLEITRAALQRIDETDAALHSWVMVDGEGALAAAMRATEELNAGMDRGPLHGVPLGVKDIYDVAGWPTRCGSAARAEAAPALDDAPAVRAFRDGGAVVLGKTVTQEFAAGVISAPARNPWDATRIPGGSSGGSAAAVAIGTCFGALGSDTGGSIRIPAAACGVCGFKPAFGELDVSGVYPLSWSLDTVGPIARTVADTELLWQVLRANGSASAAPAQDDALHPGRVRLGVARPFFFDAVQPRVKLVLDQALAALAAAGITIVETPWREAAAARACGFLINRIETAAVHERAAISAPESFASYGPDLRLRVAAGRQIPATLYIRALRARPLIRDSMAALFAHHDIDALLAPALATTAIPADRLVIEETGRDESVGAAWTRLTMPFNATGQPVLTLPGGIADDGLPVGLQLAGKPGSENRLFATGRLIEEILGMHTVRPDLDQIRTAARALEMTA